MFETFDLEPFEKAIKTLDEVVERYKQDDSLFIRDSLVQRFEYNYELAYKFLRRYLMETEPNTDEIREYHYFDIIRLGLVRGILKKEPKDWDNYRKARNKTSHTYGFEHAALAVDVAEEFLAEIKFLLSELKKRIEKEKLCEM